VSARFRHILAASLATVVLLEAPAVQAQRGNDRQRVYRWVDDAGVVHYGDAIPPEFVDYDRDILNEQGVAVGFEEGLVTEDERAEKERVAAAEEAARQAKAAAAQRDRILLETYLSVSEIEDLRDRRLELLESQIKVTEQYLANLRKRLGTLQSESQLYKPHNTSPDAPELPDNLVLDLSRTLASIRLYEQTLLRSRTEQDSLRQAFAADITRFRELKGI
jgi:hypothetical protein